MPLHNVRKTAGDSAWFTHDRLGLFIHFGTYAINATGEWCKRTKFISEEAYEKYFTYFNPDLFDAREWARAAKEAGMKYAVLTTKHHEGFCLFDSAYTDYKITNTAFGRDLVKEYVEAFRAEGLKVGFYYSLLDWHHPAYLIDEPHPRSRPTAGIEERQAGRDQKKYNEYMRNQVEELLTNYGKIDLLWFDFSFNGPNPQNFPELAKLFKGKGKEDWESEKLMALIRHLQPHILVNNRLGIEGDIRTPEQVSPIEWLRHEETGEKVVWEACQTMHSGNWGYCREDKTVKSPEMMIRMLIHSVSLGGNLLMNVGPTARGCFPEAALDALRVYGRWMKYNGRAIYGCTMAEEGLKAPDGCLLTQSEDGKRLYIHILNYPLKQLPIKGITDRIRFAVFLFDGSELTYRKNELHTDLQKIEVVEDTVTFDLPITPPDSLYPVIEVYLD